MTSNLPRRVRAWAESCLPYPVVDVQPIGGGFTNTKWILRLGERDPLVLRWADPEIWGATGREHVQREVLACRLLADSDLPVPKLVASDVDGVTAGGPANLLTWLPGRVRHERLGPTSITELARLAVAVHRRSVPADHRPPTFAYRVPIDLEIPVWARWPELWRRAIELWTAGPPPTPYGLLHRDFHLGNVLWQGDRVTGLVDWAETSWGPADLDVAHLCSDFAMLHTIAEAEAFCEAYSRQGGRLDPDPDAARYWAISDILGFLPDPAHILVAVSNNRPDLTAADVRFGLEDLLARTLAIPPVP